MLVKSIVDENCFSATFKIVMLPQIKMTENFITRSILHPLTSALRLTGVPITRHKTKVTKLWCALCVVVCTQASVYSLYHRLSFNYSQENNWTAPTIYDSLLTVSMCKTLVLDLTTFFTLVSKCGPFLDVLWERCATFQCELSHPKTNQVKTLSYISLIYLKVMAVRVLYATIKSDLIIYNF